MTSFDKYQIISTLGEGSFGKVKLAKLDDEFYAIKFSTTNNAYSQQTLRRIFQKQALILRELDNPNIIKLKQIVVNGKYHKNTSTQLRSGLVFQYAPYNLADILQLGALEQTICRTLFVNLIQGIQYLHSKNIIHRDIKPQNLLFDSNYNIKICDFGLSTKIDNDTKPKTICGSDSFKSPEMLMKKNYNGVMNDLFAAGVTLFILMTGKAPFNNATPNTGLYQFIALNYPEKFWKAHDKKQIYSLQFKNLINSMLSFDPTHRLSIAQILSHPWMTSDILMGSQLSEKLKAIQEDRIQKKRKEACKALRNKDKFQMADKLKRETISSIPKDYIILKKLYNSKLAKLSDRFVPRLTCREQIQFLFEKIGNLSINNRGNIQLQKIIQQQIESITLNKQPVIEEYKLKIEILIQEIDKETDCMKFKLLEGNIVEFSNVLQGFDSIVIEN